jgi:SAM-dependent methyltransferase
MPPLTTRTYNPGVKGGGTALRRRRGDYGFDAPYVPAFLGLGAVVGVAAAVFNALNGAWLWAGITGAFGAYLLASAASYVYTTRAGKFAVWEDILSGLQFQGEERVLDMGCGRGAVLLMVAQLVPRGRAVGIDLWKSTDQSGNDPEVTRRNAELEGVADRVELKTGDMSEMPFPEGSFDLVVSSLAVHNIKEKARRDRAVAEAVRVLRPGGRLALADFQHTQEYAARLRELGMERVLHHRLDWRFWYGGPWTATKLVLAAKPG